MLLLPIDIERQRLWSLDTFGPGLRTGGLTKHIEKELDEIRAEPQDLSEWVDVIILALDGAWRSGHTGREIIDAYHEKMRVNIAREWPDWREGDEDTPIEHVRN